jgi:hypothetical protein
VSESYWGPVPSLDEADTAAFEAKSQPAWEKVVNFPTVIVFFPLRLVFAGIEETVEAAGSSPTIRRLARLFPLGIGGALVTGGISLDTADGFGANASVIVPEFLGPRNGMKLKLAALSKGEGQATLGFLLHRGDWSVYELGGGYRSDINTRFFGIGPDSQEDSESFYRREVSWVGGSWHRALGGGFGWKLTGLYSGVAASGSSESDNPHLSQEFAAALPSGYRDLSTGVTLGLELAHDNIEKFGADPDAGPERARPEHGGVRRAVVSWFEGKGDSPAEFLTWRAELQQFLPLWFSRRALAFRAFASGIENQGDDPVPFQRLLTNDDPDLFRGYPDSRFHDLGIAAVSLEYRWPIWGFSTVNGPGVDAYLFTDWGQVYSNAEEIDGDHVTKSWGGGLRLGGDGRLTGRLEIGKSEEGVQFRLRADQVFQYEKGGLFHGRSPVPDR